MYRWSGNSNALGLTKCAEIKINISSPSVLETNLISNDSTYLSMQLILLLFLHLTNAQSSGSLLGCYKDSGILFAVLIIIVIRDLNTAFYESIQMTVDSCVNFCTGAQPDTSGNRIERGQGLPFAALQNGNKVSYSNY